MFDTRELLYVNQSQIQQNLEQHEDSLARKVTLVMATWGRGADPKLLELADSYRTVHGFNGTKIASIPLDQLSPYLPEAIQTYLLDQPQRPEQPWVLSQVFKEHLLVQWSPEHGDWTEVNLTEASLAKGSDQP